MKKVALLITAFVFSIAVMAQTESKTSPTPGASKVTRSVSSKTKTETAPV